MRPRRRARCRLQHWWNEPCVVRSVGTCSHLVRVHRGWRMLTSTRCESASTTPRARHSQQVQPPLIGANISPRYRARVKSQASWASKALVASWSHSVKPPSPLAADKFTPDFCHRRQPAGPIGDSLSSPTHLLPLPTLVFTPYCEAPFRQSVHLGFPVVPAICSLVAGLALLGCASRWRSEHEAAMLNPTPTVRELACVDGTSPAILPVALGPLGQIPARYPGFSKGSTVSSRASIRRSVSLPWGHIRYIVRIGATLNRSREPDGWQLKS